MSQSDFLKKINGSWAISNAERLRADVPRPLSPRLSSQADFLKRIDGSWGKTHLPRTTQFGPERKPIFYGPDNHSTTQFGPENKWADFRKEWTYNQARTKHFGPATEAASKRAWGVHEADLKGQLEDIARGLDVSKPIHEAIAKSAAKNLPEPGGTKLFGGSVFNEGNAEAITAGLEKLDYGIKKQVQQSANSKYPGNHSADEMRMLEGMGPDDVPRPPMVSAENRLIENPGWSELGEQPHWNFGTEPVTRTNGLSPNDWPGSTWKHELGNPWRPDALPPRSPTPVARVSEAPIGAKYGPTDWNPETRMYGPGSLSSYDADGAFHTQSVEDAMQQFQDVVNSAGAASPNAFTGGGEVVPASMPNYLSHDLHEIEKGGVGRMLDIATDTPHAKDVISNLSSSHRDFFGKLKGITSKRAAASIELRKEFEAIQRHAAWRAGEAPGEVLKVKKSYLEQHFGMDMDAKKASALYKISNDYKWHSGVQGAKTTTRQKLDLLTEQYPMMNERAKQMLANDGGTNISNKMLSEYARSEMEEMAPELGAKLKRKWSSAKSKATWERPVDSYYELTGAVEGMPVAVAQHYTNLDAEGNWREVHGYDAGQAMRIESLKPKMSSPEYLQYQMNNLGNFVSSKFQEQVVLAEQDAILRTFNARWGMPNAGLTSLTHELLDKSIQGTLTLIKQPFLHAIKAKAHTDFLKSAAEREGSLIEEGNETRRLFAELPGDAGAAAFETDAMENYAQRFLSEDMESVLASVADNAAGLAQVESLIEEASESATIAIADMSLIGGAAVEGTAVASRAVSMLDTAAGWAEMGAGAAEFNLAMMVIPGASQALGAVMTDSIGLVKSWDPRMSSKDAKAQRQQEFANSKGQFNAAKGKGFFRSQFDLMSGDGSQDWIKNAPEFFFDGNKSRSSGLKYADWMFEKTDLRNAQGWTTEGQYNNVHGLLQKQSEFHDRLHNYMNNMHGIQFHSMEHFDKYMETHPPPELPPGVTDSPTGPSFSGTLDDKQTLGATGQFFQGHQAGHKPYRTMALQISYHPVNKEPPYDTQVNAQKGWQIISEHRVYFAMTLKEANAQMNKYSQFNQSKYKGPSGLALVAASFGKKLGTGKGEMTTTMAKWYRDTVAHQGVDGERANNSQLRLTATKDGKMCYETYMTRQFTSTKPTGIKIVDTVAHGQVGGLFYDKPSLASDLLNLGNLHSWLKHNVADELTKADMNKADTLKALHDFFGSDAPSTLQFKKNWNREQSDPWSYSYDTDHTANLLGLHGGYSSLLEFALGEQDQGDLSDDPGSWNNQLKGDFPGMAGHWIAPDAGDPEGGQTITFSVEHRQKESGPGTVFSDNSGNEMNTQSRGKEMGNLGDVMSALAANGHITQSMRGSDQGAVTSIDERNREREANVAVSNYSGKKPSLTWDKALNSTEMATFSDGRLELPYSHYFIHPTLDKPGVKATFKKAMGYLSYGYNKVDSSIGARQRQFQRAWEHGGTFDMAFAAGAGGWPSSAQKTEWKKEGITVEQQAGSKNHYTLTFKGAHNFHENAATFYNKLPPSLLLEQYNSSPADEDGGFALVRPFTTGDMDQAWGQAIDYLKSIGDSDEEKKEREAVSTMEEEDKSRAFAFKWNQQVDLDQGGKGSFQFKKPKDKLVTLNHIRPHEEMSYLDQWGSAMDAFRGFNNSTYSKEMLSLSGYASPGMTVTKDGKPMQITNGWGQNDYMSAAWTKSVKEDIDKNSMDLQRSLDAMNIEITDKRIGAARGVSSKRTLSHDPVHSALAVSQQTTEDLLKTAILSLHDKRDATFSSAADVTRQSHSSDSGAMQSTAGDVAAFKQ